MKTLAFGWVGASVAAVLATAPIGACGRPQQLVNASVVSSVVDSAMTAVGAAQARVREFRDQQFSYIDQLRAAIKDASDRGDLREAQALTLDLADTQVATMDDWRSLKHRLDRDLDRAADARAGRRPAS